MFLQLTVLYKQSISSFYASSTVSFQQFTHRDKDSMLERKDDKRSRFCVVMSSAPKPLPSGGPAADKESLRSTPAPVLCKKATARFCSKAPIAWPLAARISPEGAFVKESTDSSWDWAS